MDGGRHARPEYGSSPLARGLPFLLRSVVDDLGIIPARAGFTSATSSPWMTMRDHPRSRGVYAYSYKLSVTSDGSSPLARGLPVLRRKIMTGFWIIPARAGFTTPPPGSLVAAEDHPRSRGVYVSEGRLNHVQQGSSPLARGLPASTGEDETHNRIIPARAGFTNDFKTKVITAQDHPRSRGVYVDLLRMPGHKIGSSPLARGLLRSTNHPSADRRIIPARAGFTTRTSEINRPVGDHPRSRGVYASRTIEATLRRGSSPLARGLPVNIADDLVNIGIIPARAGFTSAAPLRDMTLCGSSPLARGLHAHMLLLPRINRIIPARAGFTPLPSCT